mmetsp:Transcript_1865/g.4274  ORF Transcript_1865/g.4274 Transcript_1865/m.4274 type:complete len:415 (-) Transcript_1865:503-1747(-)
MGEDAEAAAEDPAVGKKGSLASTSASLSHRGSQESATTGDEAAEGNGNLFLTCLRLRFEECERWSEALQVPPAAAEADEEHGEEDHHGHDGDNPDDQEHFSPRSHHAGTEAEDLSPDSRASWRQRVRFVRPQRGATKRLLRRLSGRLRQDSNHPGPARTTKAFPEPLPLRIDGFGRMGEQVELSVDDEGVAAVASQHGSAPVMDSAICFTSLALRPALVSYGAGGDLSARGPVFGPQKFYFELEILEQVARTARTMSIGFSWDADLHKTDEVVSDRFVKKLPHMMVIGGELPRAYLASQRLPVDIAWRPILHLQEGSFLAVTLEVSPSLPPAGTSGEELDAWLDDAAMSFEALQLRLRVWQDGTKRAEVLGSLDWAEEGRLFVLAALSQEPSRGIHGLVDLRGSVRSAKLRGIS